MEPTATPTISHNILRLETTVSPMITRDACESDPIPSHIGKALGIAHQRPERPTSPFAERKTATFQCVRRQLLGR